MARNKTLVVRHLPPNLTDEEKRDLIEHFGAVKVKVISSKVNKTSLVFATFPSEEESSIALQRLHQLDVLGYPLCVEYAKDKDNTETVSDLKQTFHVKKDDKENSRKHFESFLRRLNTWHSSVDFNQPPPAHLRYQYPPPSFPVLVNIMRALASVPKFYTQVLHLMNKMNLPPPFDCVFPEPDILKQNRDFPSTDFPVCNLEDLEHEKTSEESEIESEEDVNQIIKDVIPMKRTLPQKKTKVKRPKFVKPTAAQTPASKTTTTTTKPEVSEVFEKVNLEPTQRKIAVILPPGDATCQPAETTTATESSEGFGLLFPSEKPNSEEKQELCEDKEKEEPCEKLSITSQELAANRISSRDQRHLSVYKNYQPGIPSCRLYIKNLSKQVEEKDLRYIYSKYIIPDFEEQGSMFDIRLMQEGRMKGQAFVTLQTVKQAQLALSQTNGFILKDKPMVVQFARSAVAKTT